ncbi:MAG: D-alanyl-D-alanine carboxypeptidase family protein, partial [Eubacteriales bacterium]
FYPGANGMKTGYTDTAKYCLSATAKRDKLQLIAAVMKAPTSDERFQDAKKLLDFGFANFSVYSTEVTELPALRVKGGVTPYVPLGYSTKEILVAKGREKQIQAVTELPDSLTAPIAAGEVVGKILYQIDGETVAQVDIVTAEAVRRMGFMDVLRGIARGSLLLS